VLYLARDKAFRRSLDGHLQFSGRNLLIARNPIWSTHGLLLSARKHLGEKSRRGSPPKRGFIENRTRHAAWPGGDAR
jgi:hypothetical protein